MVTTGCHSSVDLKPGPTPTPPRTRAKWRTEKTSGTRFAAGFIRCLPPGFIMVHRSEEAQMNNQKPETRGTGRREFLKASGAVTAALLAPSVMADTQKSL